jgi:cupin superfamily acireductone dioxygenase involved in methionine salvage
MGQVTIYVEDSALEAAKRAAERAKVSVSQWFAKQAIEERQRQSQSWETFFAEIDQLRNPNDGPDGWDELLLDRNAGLGRDTPRESF